jgi:hypothetical protein
MKIQKMLLLTLLLGSPLVFAGSVDQPLKIQKNMDSSAAKSQKKIDSLNEKTLTAVEAYRTSIQRAEGFEVYNAQLKKLVESQREEMTSISSQIAEIDNIETGVMPLMLKMTKTLEELITVDAPFLIDEREQRVQNLTELLDRADVSVGEKFRRILEAYMIETEYGRTIEAYQDELVLDSGEPLTVDVLRVGRVGLYYQTLDGHSSGHWSKKNNKWVPLGPDYRRPILDGLRIARKQAPPELLSLAVEAPGE